MIKVYLPDDLPFYATKKRVTVLTRESHKNLEKALAYISMTDLTLFFQPCISSSPFSNWSSPLVLPAFVFKFEFSPTSLSLTPFLGYLHESTQYVCVHRQHQKGIPGVSSLWTGAKRLRRGALVHLPRMRRTLKPQLFQRPPQAYAKFVSMRVPVWQCLFHWWLMPPLPLIPVTQGDCFKTANWHLLISPFINSHLSLPLWLHLASTMVCESQIATSWYLWMEKNQTYFGENISLSLVFRPKGVAKLLFAFLDNLFFGMDTKQRIRMELRKILASSYAGLG